MGVEPTIQDPFRYCETGGCTHDLSIGVLVMDLLDRDGPYPAGRAPLRAVPARTAGPLEEAA